MTPEELNRTIEFLVKHQAQFSVDLQRDHEMLNRGFDEMRKGFAEIRKDVAELQKSIKSVARLQTEMAVNHRRVAELIEIESERLDRNDEAHRQYERWQQEFQRETRAQHQEAIARLDRILERLTRNDQKPS